MKDRVDSEDNISPEGELTRRKRERQYNNFWNKAHEEFKKKYGEDFKGFDITSPIDLEDERAREDLDNFVNGRSKYIRGKGWNESVARRVTESVIRKLRESKNTDNINRYEEALLGTSLLVESSNYPYLFQLNNISDVFIEIEGMRRGEVCISDRYGTGLTLTPQEVEDLIEKGVVQGTRHGVVAWVRYPQQRAEAMERMYRLLKIYHPDLP